MSVYSTALTRSPPTRNGLRGRRSIHGARNSGRMNVGTSWIATISADASVLPVSSNTRNDSAKPPMMPPSIPSAVAAVTSVKFLVQSVCFIFLTSAIL